MFCLVCVLCFGVGILAAPFDNEIKPSCTAETKVCEFDWLVELRESMVEYDFSKDKAWPIIEKDGHYLKRLPDDCNVTEPYPKEKLTEGNIFTADGAYRHIYTINKQFPGPTITVYENQQVVVRVRNGLLSEGITIHWHGIVQKNTQWMDGVGSVSQCPINPGETFTYRFKATPTGTHFYHSHTGTQRTDGMYGALIVLPRESRDMPEDMDEPLDAAKDYVMLITDWFHHHSSDLFLSYYIELSKFLYYGYDNLGKCHTRTQQEDGSEVGTFRYISGLVNGKGWFDPEKMGHGDPKTLVPLETYTVKKNYNYRFRAVNAGMNWAYKISIDKHKLHVVSTDGDDIKDEEVDFLIVHGGERYVYYIEANQDIDNYWIRLETLDKTRGEPKDWDNPDGQVMPAVIKAVLHYDGANPDKYPNSTHNDKRCSMSNICRVLNCPFELYPEMDHMVCVDPGQFVSHKVYDLPEITEDNFEEHFFNFHFPSGIGGLLRSQINGIQFAAPSVPAQIAPKAKNDNACDMKECSEKPCHCTHQVKFSMNKVVQLVLVNTVTPLEWEGLPAAAHPVHLHGYHFHVVKIGFPVYNETTKKYSTKNKDYTCPTERCNNATWTDPSWKGGHVPGVNTNNPVLKDTVLVPIGGYAVIRFYTDNPGFWIMHCHLELHHVEGMAALLQVGEPEDMAPPPLGFPTCGTFDWSEEEFESRLNWKKGDVAQTTCGASGLGDAFHVSLFVVIALVLLI